MRLIAPYALVLLAPVAASAGGGQSHPDPYAVVQHIFESADQDGSGALTPAEYEAAGLQRFGVSFEASDANADGETSFDEYLDLYEKHHPSPDRSGA